MRYLYRWQCQNRRYSIREKGTTSTFRYKQPRCRWDKTYDNLPTDYECVLTHCDNATNTPSSTHNYNFTWDENIILIGDIVEYKCKGRMALENNTAYKHNASTSLYIHCLEDGLLHYPDKWTMCSEAVNCPLQLPAKPANNIVNGESGHDGFITYLDGAVELEDTYDTKVEYRCANGSQFVLDTGTNISIRSRCQWNKQWSPFNTSLPPCVVTHCVQTLPIPQDTFLEELENEWVLVGQDKQYQCRGRRQDGTHSRFWENNRSKSTFSMTCLEDGTFDFVNLRINWPTCLEGNIIL